MTENNINLASLVHRPIYCARRVIAFIKFSRDILVAIVARSAIKSWNLIGLPQNRNADMLVPRPFPPFLGVGSGDETMILLENSTTLRMQIDSTE